MGNKQSNTTMSDQSTVKEEVFEKDPEKNQENTEIISIKAGRLLKLKHRLRELRLEALNGYSEQLKEVKLACTSTNALLGELNEAAGGEKTDS